MNDKRKKELSKPSKKYVLHLFLFVGNTSLIILLAVFIVLRYTVLKDVIPDSIMKLAFSLIAFLLPFEKQFFDGIRDKMPWQHSLRRALRRKKLTQDSLVRISYSAVIIIEINGKYLMEKNTHGLETYFLPARVYELSVERKNYLVKTFKIKEDSFFKKDYCDYRLYVKARNLKRFYREFLNDVDPFTYDYSPWIKEEIVDGLSLPKDIFEKVDLEFDTRIIRPIQFARRANCFEMYSVDRVIFKPTEEQYEILLELVDKEFPGYRFNTLEEIKMDGVNKDKGKVNADIPDYVYDTIVFDKDND